MSEAGRERQGERGDLCEAGRMSEEREISVRQAGGVRQR